MIKSLFKSIKNLLLLLLLLILLVGGYFVSQGYIMYKEAIEAVSLEEKIKNIKADEDYVTIDEVAINFKDAIISIEDKRFYEHFGVDIYSIFRALIKNFQEKDITGGGSTITQQFARNMYFTQEQKLARKVAEVFVALDLEANYEKDDIVEMYINVIYFGDGYNGIKEASIGYFDKNPIELDLYESSLLAAIPNAPSIYQLSNKNKYTYIRQKLVLNSMKDNRNITSEELEEVLKHIKENE